MSRAHYFRQLASRCNQIAGEVSDRDGFVSIHRLVERFGVSVLIRPLLVEAMLASTERIGDGRDSENGHRWCLMLDRETHAVKESEITHERFGSPLPARFRNTVAHELAHSLAFRPTEFGVQFPRQFTSEKSKQEFVQSIERETEKLSPLLLLTEAMLDRVFPPNEDRASIQELCITMRSAGASRYVFVNRLNLLDFVDELRLKSRRSMTNFAIGMGEWLPKGEVIFKEWPFFSNFEGGKVPGFLFQLQKRIPLNVKSVFVDSTFHLCGGSSDSTECVVLGGTPRNPGILSLPIRCSVEVGPRNVGSNFLFIIQSLGRPD
jgi:hypothetical protein